MTASPMDHFWQRQKNKPVRRENIWSLHKHVLLLLNK